MLSNLNNNQIKKIIGNDKFVSYGNNDADRRVNYFENINISLELWNDISQIELSIKNRVFIKLNLLNKDWHKEIKLSDSDYKKLDSKYKKLLSKYHTTLKEIGDYNTITKNMFISKITFGTVLKIIKIIKKIYNVYPSNYLGKITENDLRIIKEYRNSIAHHENIYSKSVAIPYKLMGVNVLKHYYIDRYLIKTDEDYDFSYILKKVKKQILKWKYLKKASVFM